MKPNQRRDSTIKCPFYSKEEKQKIFCEGVQDRTTIQLAFDSKDELRTYKDQYCKRCYNQCLLAGMQNRRWGYDA
jgi:hypothetical protein